VSTLEERLHNYRRVLEQSADTAAASQHDSQRRPSDSSTQRESMDSATPDRPNRVLAVAAACVIVASGIAGLILAQLDASPTRVSVLDTALDNTTIDDDLDDVTATTVAAAVPPAPNAVSTSLTPATNGGGQAHEVNPNLVYDNIPGMDPDLRVGEPRAAEEVAAALAQVKEIYGGVRVGDIYVDDGSIDFDTMFNLPFVPVGRTFGGDDTYVIGWLDQETNRNWSSEEGLMPIAYVYNDDGVAIGSVPFPDTFPKTFPLPPHLDALRHLLDD
jgi:hypothetical protein